MIVFDPKVNRFRDTVTGRVVSDITGYLSPTGRDTLYMAINADKAKEPKKKKPKEKLKEKEKEELKPGSVKDRLRKIVEDFDEIMDEEVLY